MDTLNSFQKNIIEDFIEPEFDYIDIDSIINDLKLDYNYLSKLNNLQRREYKEHIQSKIESYLNGIITKNSFLKKFSYKRTNLITKIDLNNYYVLPSGSKDFNIDRLSFNNNIFVRMGLDYKNLIDMIEKMINVRIDEKYLKKIYKNIADDTGLNLQNVIDLFEFRYKNDVNIIINNEQIIKIIEKLVEQLYIQLSLSVCIFSSKLKLLNLKNTFIYENQYIPSKLYFINLIYSIEDIILFEPLYILNLNNKTINPFLNDINHIEHIIKVKELELKVKQNLQYNPVFLDKEDITEIEFDPYDKDEDLPVIEIEFENEKRTFLLGKTNNLYADDNHMNNLVGKLKFTDSTYTQARIYWCKGYME